MKIISSYKDYYDYLSGIYGVDEKIILDRRNFHTPFFTGDTKTKLRLFICDMVFEGIYYQNKYYWGENVLDFLTEDEFQIFKKSKNKDKFYIKLQEPYNKYSSWNSEYVKGKYNFTISLKPYPDKYKRNTKYNCAVLITSNVNEDTELVEHYPPLKDYGVASILPPQDIYLMLTAWLAPKEEFTDTRTDKEKITGSGFDLKTSFRKM